MEELKDLLKSKDFKKTQRKVMYWQEVAVEIIEFLEPPKNKYSSIFKTCKDDVSRAHRSYIACKELNKPFIDYYFKVFNEYGKK